MLLILSFLASDDIFANHRAYAHVRGFPKKAAATLVAGIELLEKTQLVRAGHSYNRTQLARNTNDAVQKYTSFKAVMISAIESNYP